VPAVPEQLADVPPERLQKIVRIALGEPHAVLGAWEGAPLLGGFGAVSGGSRLYMLQGQARVGTVEQSWLLVLKVLASVADQGDPMRIRYWQRERLLYDSDLLDDLADGLRAPRCYGCDDLADGTVQLWLEHVREVGEHTWPLARWALAAQHLGRFNGAYLVGRPLPPAPWLGGQRLRTWLEHHDPLVARIAAAPHNPDVRSWWPGPVVDAILRLWDERDAYCTALERLPQTFCHGDAIRRNLLACHGPAGSEETVLVDWEYAGRFAVGEEVGQTLSVAGAFFHVDPSDLPALDEALFTGYMAGLRDVGWRGNPRQVRFAYAAHAALRNAFNAVGTITPDAMQRAVLQEHQGHTWEELAERRAEIRPFLLTLADEARGLLKTL
jgi:hypothetical protein